MSRTIKGRYVALVEIDIHVTDTDGVRPFEEIKEDMVGGPLTEALQKEIEAIFGDDADVNVTQQYADVYEVKDVTD
jgi:hypothetical protein